MTIEEQLIARNPRTNGSNEIPTVRAPQARHAPLSFTRYLAPPEERFCNRLWAEYKRHAREQTRDFKK